MDDFSEVKRTALQQLKSSFQPHSERYFSSKLQLLKQDDKGSKGRVSLVGAGPSDPELLTVKALRALEQADVVVYDRLVSQGIIALANPNAEHIYVGKRCGKPSLTQAEINEILVDRAIQGNYVVRIKGGDPLIFGRGGEEGMALVEAGIKYEFIPGITAAIGCAASAYIPLTHREVSRSVTLVTGHVAKGSFDAWSQLVANGQTLVFYMGLEKAADIQQQLISAKLHPSTPIAIICHGCSDNQMVYVEKLDGLATLAQELKGESPALIIIGEVVALRKQLQGVSECLSKQINHS
ncbi:uroporphyrinogen-III C-methyltransferase [Photobacterium leiognathi subsp. mandapamensis]|uniref:uroporphyrinogen-III C-methyltransferase n=1 Tax=Photobacterium leiognathi TaxID=553611 RepID=UPI000D15ECF4|nr:uroporphyrinogen-III C-methyltransferase [Photobacterium leiognathi]PSV01410.1 uroporphyrinogen-III C-methyltransferase [Photobacterium leiognathi subsp. mandapamensis]